MEVADVQVLRPVDIDDSNPHGIRKNFAEPGQTLREVIGAREISEGLLLACSMVPGANLFEYELSLSLTRVDETRA